MSLPSGYTQVEYIESSGTQYIDTKFSPNQDTRVVCKAQYTDISGSFCLFGARYSVSERRYDFLVTGKQFFSEYNSNSGSYTTLPATTDVLEIDKNKNVTTVNGVTHSSHNYVAFQAPCNMLLFAENTNDSPHLQAKAKIYYFQIYDNGVLVRDFVPCKNSGGVFGMYDLANGVFYQNAGSGAFVAGPEVMPPDAPTGLIQLLAVRIAWAAVSGATSYNVYRNDVLIGSTETTFFVDADAEENMDYIYGVASVGIGGESAKTTMTVYTRSGYFQYKPLIESANFQ